MLWFCSIFHCWCSLFRYSVRVCREVFVGGGFFLVIQECDSELPEHLSEFETPPSPPSSYNNELLNEDDFSKLPPETPPQLHTFINVLSSSSDSHQHPLPQPQLLNHLYIQNHVEGRFTALGSTRRFRQKYVTMVLYKPLSWTSWYCVWFPFHFLFSFFLFFLFMW